jgi:hypothetical protein
MDVISLIPTDYWLLLMAGTGFRSPYIISFAAFLATGRIEGIFAFSPAIDLFGLHGIPGTGLAASLAAACKKGRNQQQQDHAEKDESKGRFHGKSSFLISIMYGGLDNSGADRFRKRGKYLKKHPSTG